jgi:hypothetical protein
MEPSSIVIGGPEVVYRAPVGTAFPALSDADAAIVSAGWTRLGVNGNKSYSNDGVVVRHPQSVNRIRPAGSTGPIKAARSEDGVVVRHPQTINRIRPAGSTGPIKAARTEEDFEVEFTLWDLTLEALADALHQGAVTDSGGERTVGLYRGFTINESAWLIRGTSPYDDTLVAQYELPRGYTEGAPEVTYQKGEPAGLQFLVVALVDPDADEGEEFGVVRAEDPDSGT